MKDPSQVREAYLLWLKGVPLRYLARRYNVRNHNLIVTRFKQFFGPVATDVTAQSLWRSILEDYEDDPTIETWVMEQVLTGQVDPKNQKHRSKHNLNQLTAYQVVKKPELMEYLAYIDDPLDSLDPEPSWDWLRLPLTIKVFTEVVSSLGYLIDQHIKANP